MLSSDWNVARGRVAQTDAFPTKRTTPFFLGRRGAGAETHWVAAVRVAAGVLIAQLESVREIRPLFERVSSHGICPSLLGSGHGTRASAGQNTLSGHSEVCELNRYNCVADTSVVIAELLATGTEIASFESRSSCVGTVLGAKATWNVTELPISQQLELLVCRTQTVGNTRTHRQRPPRRWCRAAGWRGSCGRTPAAVS